MSNKQNEKNFENYTFVVVVVWIGDNVKIGKRCIIKDNCVIESGVTLGDDTVIPPFTRISRSNPTAYQELPPRTSALLQEMTIDRFTQFAQVQRERSI
jgi:acetyltransferase-like isoleucine patch superfamily enzyme